MHERLNEWARVHPCMHHAPHASYSLALVDPYLLPLSPFIQVKPDHIAQLGVMGSDCYATTALPLSRVAHCVTASLATLAANPDAAMLIMTSPNDVALNFLMAMLDAQETENFEQVGGRWSLRNVCNDRHVGQCVHAWCPLHPSLPIAFHHSSLHIMLPSHVTRVSYRSPHFTSPGQPGEGLGVRGCSLPGVPPHRRIGR
jgi:hypothetical protein